MIFRHRYAHRNVNQPFNQPEGHPHENFAEGLFPLVSEAHCGYTSLHEYVIQIKKSQTNKKVFQPAFRCMQYPKAGQNTQHIPPPVAKHLLYTSLPALCCL